MRTKKIVASLLCSLLLLSCAVPIVSALEPYGNNVLIRNWVRNDPNYEFSDAYKTSVWYENFTDLELSDNERNNVLRIAVSQLGYHEGNSAKDFDGMNQTGSGNYIEYARLIVPNYNDNHYEWCACFVNWCLSQAQIDHCYGEISCWKWVQWLKDKTMFRDSAAYGGSYEPQPADMIFFNWDGVNTGSGHIGLVLYCDESKVYTIEGNTSSGFVAVRSYALNDPCVIGYGTPEYNEGTEPTMDFSYANGHPRGTYIVNSTAANLSAKPSGGSRIYKIPIGSRVLATGTEDGYMKVQYKDKEGYLPLGILVLLNEMEGFDTVTFDANGGTSAPEAQEIPMGDGGVLTSDVPSLEGDTFLGWATRPYDLLPVYQPGDRICLEGDITLYAIWEKHSAALAEDAMAEGVLVSLPRPEETNNPSALIMSTYLPMLLSPVSDTAITIVEDEAYGSVLSLATTGRSNDPYVTIPYAQLMKTAELAPTSADDVKYVVLLVKNESLSNTAFDMFYTCTGEETTAENDQTARIVTASVAKEEGWQYIVFDMSTAKGWSGQITSLRLDYQRAALAAGESMLLSDIYFLEDDDQLAALKDGIYFFPEAEKMQVPVETTPDGEEITLPEGETHAPVVGDTQSPSDDTSHQPANGTDAGEDTGSSRDGGCSSSVMPIGIPAITLCSAAVLTLVRRKRGEDE